MSDSDSNLDYGKHETLLKSIKEIGKANDKPKRLAPKKSNLGKVDVSELVSSIHSTRNLNEVKKQIDVLDKKKKVKTLSAPLHRLAKNRIESEIAYKEVNKELKQWDPIVFANRAAEQLKFPLDREVTMKVETAAERTQSFKPRTSLEIQTAEILNNSKHNLRNDDLYTEAEKEIIKAMSLKEAKEKCAQLQKMRALMSYREAKYKQQKKIKSKQFHRLKKRQKRRQILKEFEELMTKDPEAAKEKLQELEKDRAMERATLTHRGSNKWNKEIRQFASRNPELKKIMEEHLRFGRELKKKYGENFENGTDEEQESEEEEGTSTEKKLTTDDILKLAAEEAAKDSLTNKGKPIEKASENPWLRAELTKIRESRKKNLKKSEDKDKTIIDNDEKNFLKIQATEVNEVPIELIDKMEDVDGMETQTDFLAAAFEDDDVMGDFESEKLAAEADEAPQDLDLTLHGWGDWTGPGIVDKKKDRFVIKAKKQKRRDKNRVGVIIREMADKTIEKFQPRIVPFPFTKAQDFEAYIQQPIGRDWNTELTHGKLVKPSVVTQAGRIIRPLDKESVIKERIVKDVSSDEEED